MKAFLALVALAIVATSHSASLSLKAQWEQFKTTHGKHYASAVEEQERFQIFAANVRFIQLHNEAAADGVHTYTLALNSRSDQTSAELRRLNGYKAPTHRRYGQRRFHANSSIAVPATMDWRQKGLVTEVKDQAQCGSCWAFSSVASLEGQHAKATGQLVSLSEQNLVDCDPNDGGCNGGNMNTAFDYIRTNGGIDTEQSYPYEAQDGQCRYNVQNRGATLTGYVTVANENDMLQAVATVGPISVAIDASRPTFQSYNGGVYADENCSQTQLDHAVTIVGYGTENGQDYWLVKNSWGAAWGLQGYIKMQRGVNMCGIADDAIYPTV